MRSAQRSTARLLLLLLGILRSRAGYRFLVENIAANGLADRVHAMHGDLRDLRLRERFALVTGSPPYFPASAGIAPADSQKVHARFELRGDLTDYAHAAKRHLAPGGVYVFCFPWQQHARALAAMAATGFAIEAFRAVVPRAGLEPLFAVYACRLGDHAPREEPPFVVRDASGTHPKCIARCAAASVGSRESTL
jgi:tRNA1(Val) A37 N6-methylase TrmN6